MIDLAIVGAGPAALSAAIYAARAGLKVQVFEKGNIVSASEYCLWASAYIIADKFNIPLIIEGEKAAVLNLPKNSKLKPSNSAPKSPTANAPKLNPAHSSSTTKKSKLALF